MELCLSSLVSSVPFLLPGLEVSLWGRFNFVLEYISFSSSSPVLEKRGGGPTTPSGSSPTMAGANLSRS